MRIYNPHMLLSNLQHHPTLNQQAELASSEFTLGVPVLLTKIRTLRPRVVCFVGMDIAERFRAALLNSSSSSSYPLVLPAMSVIRAAGTDALGEAVPKRYVLAMGGKARVRIVTAKMLLAQERARVKLVPGMQPFKVVHPPSPGLSFPPPFFFAPSVPFGTSCKC